ncbi:SPOR domain-containing protein [Niallia nealsonii]|uniref:SPOR domain-containing protein n=1 Tax=Niallia nealsonii TaxID=115979 RepID=UPI0038B3C37B
MVQSENLYKVQIGAFSKKSNADALASKAKSSGFDTIIIQLVLTKLKQISAILSLFKEQEGPY